jgi:thymidylate synthase
MPIKQEFKFTPQEGQELITLHQWVSTLTENEQTEFCQAEQRQLEFRQKVVDVNVLTIINNSKDNTEPDNYIWDESHVENKTISEYKDCDSVWVCYWNRYLKETGTTFEIIETKI